jgi:hypothetical protein
MSGHVLNAQEIFQANNREQAPLPYFQVCGQARTALGLGEVFEGGVSLHKVTDAGDVGQVLVALLHGAG